MCKQSSNLFVLLCCSALPGVETPSAVAKPPIPPRKNKQAYGEPYTHVNETCKTVQVSCTYNQCKIIRILQSSCNILVLLAKCALNLATYVQDLQVLLSHVTYNNRSQKSCTDTCKIHARYDLKILQANSL